MTAPDTDVEKQAKRHRWSLIGIAVAVLAAIVVAIVLSAGSEELNEDDAAAVEQVETE